MHKTSVVVVLSIACLATALAASPGQYASKEGTECWACHAPDVWVPPMADPVPSLTFEQRDGQWWLLADLDNNWTHDLRHVGAVLHGVDELAYRGEVLPETIQGSFPMDLASTGQQKIQPHTIQPLGGSGGLNITLTWSATGPHDMQMTVSEPGGEQLGSNDERQGRIEVRLSPEELATYSEELVIQVELFNNLPEQVDYTITFDSGDGPAWARGTSAPAGGHAAVEWPLDGVGNGTSQADVTFYYESFYDHEDTSIEDLGFVQMSIFPEIGTFDGQPYFVEPEVEEEEDEFLAPGPGILLVPALAWAVRRARA